MNEILKADFRNAKIGDRVKHINGTIGTIIKVVDFPNPQCCGVYVRFIDGEEKFYNYDGFSILEIRTNKYNHPELFYNFEGQFPTIEACTRPLPKIEVDEKVLVMRGSSWYKLYTNGYVSKDGIVCYSNGATSWNGEEIEFYGTWKLASDETINSGNLDEIEN